MINLRGSQVDEQNISASGAFFSCYTEVLQSEMFISTALVM